MGRLLVYILLLIQLCVTYAAQASSAPSIRTITYAYPFEPDDRRTDFPLRVLRMIFEHMPEEYRLKRMVIAAPQERIMSLIEEEVVDVFWTGIDEHRLQNFQPVRIPISKGLLGVRLFLINADNPHLLKDVESLGQLQSLRMGQGLGWPDIDILKHSGLRVYTTPSYESLFHMVRTKRFDLFPRSVIEIWDELNSPNGQGLMADQYVLLHYPLSMFYFVRKDDQKLASDMHRGFKSIIDSGEYEVEFQRSYQNVLRQAELNSRKRIRIPNPQFSIPEEEKAYYYAFPDDTLSSVTNE